jgi:hypothetical protein
MGSLWQLSLCVGGSSWNLPRCFGTMRNWLDAIFSHIEWHNLEILDDKGIFPIEKMGKYYGKHLILFRCTKIIILSMSPHHILSFKHIPNQIGSQNFLRIFFIRVPLVKFENPIGPHVKLNTGPYGEKISKFPKKIQLLFFVRDVLKTRNIMRWHR